MGEIEKLTRKIVWVETVLIGLAVAAIAYADWLVGTEVSLGFLYLIPLSYCAVTHNVTFTLLLVGLCVLLRQWLGPLQLATWELFIRDWVLTGVFLSVVSALFRLGRDRREFFEQARSQRDELLREVRLAAGVQSRLLDRNAPPPAEIDVSARCWPLGHVGGDYYDFVDLGDKRLCVVIADVAGKGLPAALLMPALQISLRTLASRGLDLVEAMQELNSVVYGATDDAAYATMFVGVLDAQNLRFDYVNAGHVPPLLIRPLQEDPSELRSGGPPVGLLESVEYEKGTVDLRPGDLLLLYTDGVVEGCNAEGEPFGSERLRKSLRKSTRESAENVVEELHDQLARFFDDGAEDDVTLIALRIP